MGVGTPSADFTIEVLFSSRMMSMQSSTHSSQMNTVGPAINLRTSCCDFPQNEQYSVFLLVSPVDDSLDIRHSSGAPNPCQPALYLKRYRTRLKEYVAAMTLASVPSGHNDTNVTLQCSLAATL